MFYVYIREFYVTCLEFFFVKIILSLAHKIARMSIIFNLHESIREIKRKNNQKLVKKFTKLNQKKRTIQSNYMKETYIV